MWIFVPLKCQQNIEILQLVWILTPILNLMSRIHNVCASSSIPSIFDGNNLIHTHLIAI